MYETTTTRIEQTIYPTDIKVFYEDGDPYVSYKGVAIMYGDTYEIEIPKMDMVIHAIEDICETETQYGCGPFGESQNQVATRITRHLYAVEDVVFTATPIKKKMSKKDIEKELGYKIEIVGDKE